MARAFGKRKKKITDPSASIHHSFIHAFIHSFTHSFSQSFICSLNNAFVHYYSRTYGRMYRHTDMCAWCVCFSMMLRRTTLSNDPNLAALPTHVLRHRVAKFNIGAYIITNTILAVPCYNCSIRGPKTLF